MSKAAYRTASTCGSPTFLGNSVTELDASNGSLVGVISASKYRFASPDAVSSDGTNAWVVNAIGDSVTDLQASDGALVRVLAGSGYDFVNSTSVSSDGIHVWVGNTSGGSSANGSLTELDASDGSNVNVISASKYQLDDPEAGFLGPHACVSGQLQRRFPHRARSRQQLSGAGDQLGEVRVRRTRSRVGGWHSCVDRK